MEPRNVSAAPLPPTESTEPATASSPSDSVTTTSAGAGGPPVGRIRKRRVWLPVILFVLTCVSTFWAGASWWVPANYLFGPDAGIEVRRTLLVHWADGLIYMACVLAILITHEMGHFLATLRYRIPATLPYCVPLPISPIGTLGAVIAMDGTRADRKQMFDIGLAGPIAGLVVAVPIMWIGILQLDLTQDQYGGFSLQCPLAVHWALQYLAPPGYNGGTAIANSQLNPYFMAGWVGLLITGLNMLPVSQLDGGHVIYTLFGKWAHWIARGFMVLAIAYVVYMGAYVWTIMILLVLLIGTDHPPTRDDNVRLGWFRTALGLASLAIPVLCFSPLALMVGT